MSTPPASPPAAPLKIGVVGCGAVGSFYGARLCRSGHEVHFLPRSDLAAVRRDGVRIVSVEGDFSVRPRVAAAPEIIGPCDLVLIGLKTTANHEFARLLPPLLGPGTALLTLQNGLGSDDELAAQFGPARVLGGLCFVCLNRVAPGVIHHLAHGRIMLGEYQRPPDSRTERVADAFRAAGVPCDVVTNLGAARWQKLVWNVPFNGLGVAGVVGPAAYLQGRLPPNFEPGPCLATNRLLGHPVWEPLVRELMEEVVATANALGFPLARALVEENLTRTRVMGTYKASTLLDFECRAPLELDSIFLEPQRRARQAGVATPRLDALGTILQALDTRRRR